MPHAYVIMLAIIIIASILTWVLPAGNYERKMDVNLKRELVVPGSYHTVGKTPINLWSLCLCIFQGFVDSADMMFFLMFACGYINLLVSTNSLTALVSFILRKLGNRNFLFILIFFILFAIGGSTFGMYEEAFGLVPAFMVIAIALGYDKIVGAVIVVVGTGIGFAAATLNPFTVGLASSIVEIPMVSLKTMVFRIASFVLFTVVSIIYILHYADKVKKDPSESIVFDETDYMTDIKLRNQIMQVPFTIQQILTLLGFIVVFVCIAIGVTVFNFYIPEIASIFFIAMILTGTINKMSPSDIATSFIKSSQSMIYTMIMIGLGRTIQIILTNGNIIDTVVFFLSNIVKHLPIEIGAIAMLITQTMISFFIPSGTGQAMVTMPIMAPIADLLGLSREVVVIAYQFGNGFATLFWPTGCAIICGVINIGMDKWYKFITKLFLMIVILQILLITVAIFCGI